MLMKNILSTERYLSSSCTKGKLKTANANTERTNRQRQEKTAGAKRDLSCIINNGHKKEGIPKTSAGKNQENV